MNIANAQFVSGYSADTETFTELKAATIGGKDCNLAVAYDMLTVDRTHDRAQPGIHYESQTAAVDWRGGEHVGSI